jgi:hypothetical protein
LATKNGKALIIQKKLQSTVLNLEKNGNDFKIKKERVIHAFHYRLVETKNEMYKMIGETQKQIQHNLLHNVKVELDELICKSRQYYQEKFKVDMNQKQNQFVELQTKFSELLNSHNIMFCLFN